MVRGRKPEPAAIKIFRGNPGNRPLPPSDEAPPLVGLEPPADLDDDGRTFWREYAPTLDAMGVLRSLDSAAFAACCRDFAEYMECSREIGSQGKIIKTKDGNLIQNPYIAIRNRAHKRWRDWLSEFGLTPSSRTRLRIGQISAIDPIAALGLDDDEDPKDGDEEKEESEADGPRPRPAVRRGKLGPDGTRGQKKARRG